jgi:hypothetical protein
MSSEAEKSKVEVEEKKRIRRTKKNDVGRDFLCPCGKSYLSYPALYTHIKNKHNGKVNNLHNFRPQHPLLQIRQ